MAAFALRDVFLPVSTRHRQMKKTDALGRGLWEFTVQSDALSRISDKSQWAWPPSHCVPAIAKETNKNHPFSFLEQVLGSCLSFRLIQHRPENVEEETREAGGVGVGVLESGIYWIHVHSLCAKHRLHKNSYCSPGHTVNREFRTALHLYLSPLYYSILWMNQDWKSYTRITHLFKSLNICWVENMCQGWFLCCGRWEMMKTWILKPRSSLKGSNTHLSNTSQYRLLQLL